MLTETKISKAQAKDKAYKLSDGGGLYIMVTPAGGKLWRLNYRYLGKQKTLSIGKWPVVSLHGAREASLEAKRRLKEGYDPCSDKKMEQKRVLGISACSWFERKKNDWRENSREFVWWTLQKHILPAMGQRPIDSITPQEIDGFLRHLASRSIVLAHRAKTILSAIFTDAVFDGLCSANPAALMRGRLPRIEVEHLPTILDPNEIGKLLFAIENVRERVKLFSAWEALRLLPFVFVRPGELRFAEWKEISFSEAIWQIPAARMKMNRPHLVPLSRQVVGILREVQEKTGSGTLVFNGRTENKPFARRELCSLIGIIGYKGKITPHGFRAMARTLLHERLHFSPDAIEAQLAHRVPDRLGNAYNRAQHLEERVRMMQVWSNYLEELRRSYEGILSEQPNLDSLKK